MNTSHATMAVRKASFIRTGGFSGLLALVSLTNAQEVVAPLPADSTSTVPPQAEGQMGDDNTTPRGGSALAAAASGIPWGPLTFHPALTYRFLYGDGIQSRPGRPTSTSINTIAPRLLTELGTHWSVDYTPTWNFYSNADFNDTLDHAVKLNGETTFEDWIFGFYQTFALTNAPLIETGQQTREKTYVTHFSAHYQFGRHLLLETAMNQNVRLASNFNDLRDWTLSEWLNLQLTPRLSFAVGGEYGYTKVSDAADMSYVRLLGRVIWHPVDKFTFQLQGGLENRTIRQKGVPDSRNPVLSASVQYKPVKTTTVSLAANRLTSASYFASQTVEDTRLSLTVEQRLLSKVNLVAGFGYQESSFRATSVTVDATRKDEDLTFNASIQTILLRKITIAITYQTAHNTSTAAGFGFSSNQYGLELRYRY